MGICFLGLLRQLLTGCPYSSEFPIDDPNIKVENSWLGKYTGNYPSDYIFASTSTLVVTKNSGFEYLVTAEDETKGPEDKEKNKGKENDDADVKTEYITHVSMLNGRSFINVKDQNYSYYIFKVDCDGKSLNLKELIPVLKQKAFNSADLRQVITKNMNNELLYASEITLTKK